MITRTARTGWWRLALAVTGNAVAQGLLVVGDPQIDDSPGFVLRVAVSAVVMILAVTVVTAAVADAADGTPAAAGGPRRLVRIAVWTATVGAVAAAGSVVTPWAGPPLLLLGAFVLPAVAAGAKDPVTVGFGAVRRAPIRYGVAIVAYLLLAALSWVVALLLGFFVTGPVSGILTWLWFGVVATAVLRWWTSLLQRRP